jgi:hypothetical protein
VRVPGGFLLLLIAGCASDSLHTEFLTGQSQQVVLGMGKGQVRGLLGLPTMESKDHLSWWYVEPATSEQPSPEAQRLPLTHSIWLWYGGDEKLIGKELLSFEVVRGQAVLRAECTWSGGLEEDFSQILTGKLSEVCAGGNGYELDRQPASFQLRKGQELLVAGETWTRAGARLARVGGRFSAQEHPRVIEAIRIGLSIRRFTIGLQFDGATRFR